ncbi:MAG: HDOD domain-containing protein [Nitrospina sp.]|jgi:HD-like signal output (HDOD) protein|nr:HDOD domain-containing protein [Nitrospina sp.]MBT6716813.1 HDOD domain-containing protein [Nitrospina sp.]
MKENLLNLLETKGDLPPLSDVLLNLENRVNDPSSDIEEISGLIQTEPVLSGRLIKLSNSVLFGGGRDEVHDLNEAIMRLGMKMVLDLAYTLELPKAFKKSKSFDHIQFWKHSLGVAYLSRSLAIHQGSSKEDLDASYLAGLMHDVGVLVFDYLIPEEYAEFIKNMVEDERPLSELEIEKFGISHSELGAEFIGKWWPVSEIVVKSVRRHHNPPPTKKIIPKIPRLVNWANQIANNNDMHNGLPMHYHPLDENIFPRLKLSNDELELIVEKTKEGVEAADMILRS